MTKSKRRTRRRKRRKGGGGEAPVRGKTIRALPAAALLEPATDTGEPVLMGEGRVVGVAGLLAGMEGGNRGKAEVQGVGEEED